MRRVGHFCQNFAQKSVLARVRLAHQQRAPPVSHESDKAALLQLLANKLPSSYGSSEAVGAVSVYQREKVSLPKDHNNPVQLDQLLPPHEAERLNSFEKRMLLGDEEMSAVLEKGLEGDMYVDPMLESSKKDYHAFVADMVRRRLVGFTDSPRAQVGHDVIVLGAMERNESSKAGIFDETLILDDTRCPSLGTLMKDLAEKRVSENKEDQPL